MLIFANTKSLGGSIVVLVFFSLFVQATEGTSYGIVPYVDPPNTGSIAGIIGAGGNTGAVGFGLGVYTKVPKENSCSASRPSHAVDDA